MRTAISLAVLAMASSFAFAFAFDSLPLQDFCVAAEDANSGVFLNGKFCKDPEHVTADDFYYSGLNIPRQTSDQLGVRTTLLTVEEIPGLNTQGLSINRIDLQPGGINPPHHHPRASEILTVLEGQIYVGFITGNPNHKAFMKELKVGDVFIVPFGLIHFQFNIGKGPAVAIAALNSQNPGVVTSANTIFGAVPSLNPSLLARAFHMDRSTMANLLKQEWVNPSDVGACPFSMANEKLSKFDFP